MWPCNDVSRCYGWWMLLSYVYTYMWNRYNLILYIMFSIMTCYIPQHTCKHICTHISEIDKWFGFRIMLYNWWNNDNYLTNYIVTYASYNLRMTIMLFETYICMTDIYLYNWNIYLFRMKFYDENKPRVYIITFFDYW